MRYGTQLYNIIAIYMTLHIFLYTCYRQYKLCMYAIGSEYGNSAVSNSLLINTPGSRFCAGQMLDSSLVDFESWEASDQTDLKV